MTALHPTLAAVTARIAERSRDSRAAYLATLHTARQHGKTERSRLGCSNLAHGYAAMPKTVKIEMLRDNVPNLGMITAYNDMVSAHQPFKHFPDQIKDEVQKSGATAQVAGGTPAMCDGITQGYEGMELSLFSRDVIAMSTAIGLSHQMFDGALYFGVCDKIVPGLMIGALSCGHLPGTFVPAGPMASGIGNKQKARTRQRFAEGKATREELLESEMASYHSPGTCTFYGTANSNQMMMELMGVHLPAAAFCPPDSPLREALTREAAANLVRRIQNGTAQPLGEMLDEKSFVNAMVGLMATGGSTNHTMHLVAMARAAGIILNWDDFDDISAVVPLLIRVYPNGEADINHFAAAGGLPFVIRELLDNGLLHEDVDTVVGRGLRAYTQEPFLIEGRLKWQDAVSESRDENIIRPVSRPFSPDGGLRLMKGNIGRGVIKVSAVREGNRVIEAPAIVFDDQKDVLAAFERGELERDFIAVVRFQGPRANGMPELHKLTPPLGILQDRGFKVALVTDGRMSGASGKVPAAIHMSPEALLGGGIGKIRTGDMLRFNSETGELCALVDEQEWAVRTIPQPDLSRNFSGIGRELFGGFRAVAGSAEHGAMSFGGVFGEVEAV
ncbi:MAG: phosphogluconate dehydratase [Neisseria sp.]|nr:phosphogluconate dehydratase [Neisseria sp.]